MQTLLMSTGEQNFSLALRLSDETVKEIMRGWRMLEQGDRPGMVVTLPVPLEWSRETPAGPFELRADLDRVYPDRFEIAPDLTGGFAAVGAAGVRIGWRRSEGGTLRGEVNVPIQIWADLEAKAWRGSVLVTAALSTDEELQRTGEALTLPLTDELRARVRAAAAWLGEHGPGEITLEGADVGFAQGQELRALPKALDLDGVGGAVALHADLVRVDQEKRPHAAAVVVTAGALSLRVTAPEGAALCSREVALSRLGFPEVEGAETPAPGGHRPSALDMEAGCRTFLS